MSGVLLTRFDQSDVDIIARLHAASWRVAYRGILADAYLDDDLESERRGVWREKLAEPASGPGWIASVAEEPAGFVFTRPHDDRTWGMLVDNLHVLAAHQGLGIGRRLLHTAGRWAHDHLANSPVYLWVYADNIRARGFYARVGGQEVEAVHRDANDGGTHLEYRVRWPSARALMEATGVD